MWFEWLILSNKIAARKKLEILNTTYSSWGLRPKLDDFLISCCCGKDVITALFLCDNFNTEDRLHILNAFNGRVLDDQINEILNSKHCTKDVQEVFINSDKVTDIQKQRIQNLKPS